MHGEASFGSFDSVKSEVIASTGSRPHNYREVTWYINPVRSSPPCNSSGYRAGSLLSAEEGTYTTQMHTEFENL